MSIEHDIKEPSETLTSVSQAWHQRYTATLEVVEQLGKLFSREGASVALQDMTKSTAKKVWELSLDMTIADIERLYDEREPLWLG